MSVTPTQAARWRPAKSAPLSVRGFDLYETPSCAVHALLATAEIERLAGAGTIWEPAAGRGAIARELIGAGFDVAASDLVAYPGADPGIETPTNFFLESRPPSGVTLVLTNPPYRDADRFIRRALALGLPAVVLLRLMALEGAGRSDLMDRHLRRVWAGIERLPTMHRQGWEGPRTAPRRGAICVVHVPAKRPQRADRTHPNLVARRVMMSSSDLPGQRRYGWIAARQISPHTLLAVCERCGRARQMSAESFEGQPAACDLSSGAEMGAAIRQGR